jgi:hypothetical protein
VAWSHSSRYIGYHARQTGDACGVCYRWEGRGEVVYWAYLRDRISGYECNLDDEGGDLVGQDVRCLLWKLIAHYRLGFVGSCVVLFGGWKPSLNYASGTCLGRQQCSWYISLITNSNPEDGGSTASEAFVSNHHTTRHKLYFSAVKTSNSASLPCSQEPATGFCSQPLKSGPRSPTPSSLRCLLILSSLLYLEPW